MKNHNLILADGERQIELCLGVSAVETIIDDNHRLSIKRIARQARQVRIELDESVCYEDFNHLMPFGFSLSCVAEYSDVQMFKHRNQLIELSLFLLNSAHPLPDQLQGYYIDIFSHLLDTHRSEINPGLQGQKRKSFILLAEYIESNIKDSISVQNLIDNSHMSERSLYYLFNEAVGMTPLAYIRQRKIKCAYRELSSDYSDRNITQIAMDFGFSCLGRFSNLYQQQVGELPSETRRKRNRLNR